MAVLDEDVKLLLAELPNIIPQDSLNKTWERVLWHLPCPDPIPRNAGIRYAIWEELGEAVLDDTVLNHKFKYLDHVQRNHDNVPRIALNDLRNLTERFINGLSEQDPEERNRLITSILEPHLRAWGIWH